MTREEAIKHINGVRLFLLALNKPIDEYMVALDMAIQALSQEPICDKDCEHCTWTECPIEPCDDAISRKAVLDIDFKRIIFTTAKPAEMIEQKIKDLPPVTQKSGKWIPVSKRLPEKSDRYLAYIVNRHDDKLQYIMTCDYSVDGYWNWFPDDESASDNVIAWMPLPKPYELKESEVRNE